MPTLMGSVLGAAARKPEKRLEVITCSAHERWQSGLAGVNARFWMVQAPGLKDWKTQYAPIPTNHVLLDGSLKEGQLPPGVNFDLVFSHNRFGCFQLLDQLAKQLHLPHAVIEHTLPMEGWPEGQRRALRAMEGDTNWFISAFSRAAWGWGEHEAGVIHHGVDTKRFCPGDLPRKKHVLSVCNDWINRTHCCGYHVWLEAKKNLPTKVVGDTPGLSKPAKNTEELVGYYQEAEVFLSTATVSPIPTVLLEAAASECAIVSTENPLICETFKHGENAFLSNDSTKLNEYCRMLLADHTLARQVGRAARKTVEEKFSLEVFVKNWEWALRTTAGMVYGSKRWRK